MEKRFERATNAMMESGLERFYWNIARLKGRIVISLFSNKETEEEENGKLRFNQCSFLFLIFTIQMAIAFMVFITELIVYHVKKANNQGIETAVD